MRSEKPRAVEMRLQGWSYSDITNALSVPKSTLSGWLRDIPYSPNKTVSSRIVSGRGAYGLSRQKMRLQETNLMKKLGEEEVGRISRRDLWMIGIGLWLGEGSKTLEQIRLANSDPQIIHIFVKWLKDICGLDDSNITIAMHLYPDSNEHESREYWMKITNLPREQFRKTQIDERTGKSLPKVGKNPFGTVHIGVISNGDRSKGVQLHRKIMGWVSATTK